MLRRQASLVLTARASQRLPKRYTGAPIATTIAATIAEAPASACISVLGVATITTVTTADGSSIGEAPPEHLRGAFSSRTGSSAASHLGHSLTGSFRSAASANTAQPVAT